MLRQGPIPRFVHGFVEYAAAVLFFLAPFLLDFQAGAATAASIVAGVIVLFLAASTEGPTSLINYVPLAAHVVLDYALAGAIAIQSSWLLRRDERQPLHRLGVCTVVPIGTRFSTRNGPPSVHALEAGARVVSPSRAHGGPPVTESPRIPTYHSPPGAAARGEGPTGSPAVVGQRRARAVERDHADHEGTTE